MELKISTAYTISLELFTKCNDFDHETAFMALSDWLAVLLLLLLESPLFGGAAVCK